MGEFFGPAEQKELETLRAEGKIPEMTEEERERVEKRMTALQQLLKKDDVAKYKIEVMFDLRKTSRGGAFPGVMVVWLNGSMMGGGGDELLYPCPDDHCTGYIGSDNIAVQSQTAYCPECRFVWKQSDLSEIRAFNMPDKLWAAVIAREFMRMSCNADIYMKVAQGKLREGVEKTHDKEGGFVAEALHAGRHKSAVLYSMQDIMRDTQGGSSVESRVLAFLRA